MLIFAVIAATSGLEQQFATEDGLYLPCNNLSVHRLFQTLEIMNGICEHNPAIKIFMKSRSQEQNNFSDEQILIKLKELEHPGDNKKRTGMYH